MGLDMYCYAVPETFVEGDKDTDVVFCEEAKEKKEEIFYWRKHHDLHGWMENLYRSKGGAAESFNCVNLRITEEDLNTLKIAITQKKLPKISGFFFEEEELYELVQLEDLRFIVLARNTIKKGMAVFYDSWW
jgi:hypothetical protein